MSNEKQLKLWLTEEEVASVAVLGKYMPLEEVTDFKKMQCLSPLSLERPNGYGATDRVSVPCGKCYSCLSNKRNEWTYRLGIEAKASISTYFVTLTYENGKDDFGNVNLNDVQLFIKRLRKQLGQIKLRYYLVSEYGSKTYRPHYHALFFFKEKIMREELITMLQKTWDKGYTMVGTVKQASIHYVTKYIINKMNYPDGLVKPFSIMSKKPGLGIEYVNENKDIHHCRNAYVTNIGGIRQAMPRYYKDKIYTKGQKAKIASDYTPKEIIDPKIWQRNNPNSSAHDYFMYVMSYKKNLQEKMSKESKNEKI